MSAKRNLSLLENDTHQNTHQNYSSLEIIKQLYYSLLGTTINKSLKGEKRKCNFTKSDSSEITRNCLVHFCKLPVTPTQGLKHNPPLKLSELLLKVMNRLCVLSVTSIILFLDVLNKEYYSLPVSKDV